MKNRLEMFLKGDFVPPTVTNGFLNLRILAQAWPKARYFPET